MAQETPKEGLHNHVQAFFLRFSLVICEKVRTFVPKIR